MNTTSKRSRLYKAYYAENSCKQPGEIPSLVSKAFRRGGADHPYQGITLPSDSIGCAVLNISDGVIEKLKQISQPSPPAIEAVGKKKLKLDLLTPCRDCILQMLELLQKENAFPLLDYPYSLKRIPEIFTEENMKNTVAYIPLVPPEAQVAFHFALTSFMKKSAKRCSSLRSFWLPFSAGKGVLS